MSYWRNLCLASFDKSLPGLLNEVYIINGILVRSFPILCVPLFLFNMTWFDVAVRSQHLSDAP
jgi:hypothetical protein